MNKYKVSIGLEMHCEFKSKSKVFSNALNEYSEIPNINVNAIDMAFPGILPTINKECVRKSILMAMILNCQIPKYLYFDRKNYYYPDLPKGYQITQMNNPIGVNGNLTIECNGEEKNILIHDIHLEEDTASLDHYSDATLINYNRAGVPLLELVTEPCLSSADEAVAFLEEVRRIYQYADISDADIKKGQIRCDVNVSISDNDELGTRVEVKNVNSIANVYETINYEIKRQSELKNLGRYDEVLQETRRFDEETGTTIRMRSKEDAIDYKYFVEPNIPKFKITEEWKEEIKKDIPMLPRERKHMYINEYNLSEYDANIIIKNKDYAEYYEECVNLGMDKKQVANWLIVQIIAYLKQEDITLKDFYLKPNLLKQILSELEKGNISSKQAKEIFNKSLENKKEPKEFIKDNTQISDKEELVTIIENILNNNLKQIEDYKNGKTNLFDYFVGQVMKETRGKANPVMTKEILKDKLN
ncbi:Asp-tRNA(Asn)/Glu-tRNA(Gln) amidotransferase subunit GatB [bacterium]|nr:Asp-tRNA(Asn)/Glu-tRNA(Gln) amidotransferase subunit GatB [bacterium]MBD8922998.1 Asp-tRNA(Asn)/Glu-tRNA(Gln) amidotransferase subunit GatB [bacterium]